MDQIIGIKMIKIFLTLLLIFSFILPAGYAGSSFQYGANAKNVSLGGSTVASQHIGFNGLSNPANLSEINKFAIIFLNSSLTRSGLLNGLFFVT